MLTWKQKLAETARKNRVELVDAKLSRRDLFKMGLLTGGGFLVTKMGLSSRAAGAAIVFLNTATNFVNPFWQKDALEILPGRLVVPSNAGVARIQSPFFFVKNGTECFPDHEAFHSSFPVLRSSARTASVSPFTVSAT